MEQTSRRDTTDALEAQLRECFGRVVYATKTHEKCADLCMRKLARVKVAQITLSALTTGGIITAVFGTPNVSAVSTAVSAVLSTILLALNTYTKDSDPGQQAEKHKKTASQLWDVRESYLSILSDLRDGHIDANGAREKRDALQERLSRVYADAPRTNATAYSDASKGLKQNEELTFSDAELDAFLPPALRRNPLVIQ